MNIFTTDDAHNYNKKTYQKMGRRKIIARQSAADNMAAVAWFIESKGLVATAGKFTGDAYDYITRLADIRKSYLLCREPTRAFFEDRCVPYNKNFTIVFIESEQELIICEFISSKLIYW